ncbi:MAG: toxin [Candidatus Riflebacteria bacterium]|nr:toxin [Candidatus Riflebacteria bacterium]
MEIVETRSFTKQLKAYLADEEYRKLQAFLTDDPEAGDVIAGTGGLRKVRWSDRQRGKGKRGGLRVIYCYFREDLQLYLMTLYDKDEADDLTVEQRRFLRAALTQEKLARKAARAKRKR